MVNKDFFLALEDLEREKGISPEAFMEALENALVLAYKKNYGEGAGITVKLNEEKASIDVYSTKEVVEVVENQDKEISLEDALAIKKTAKVGDVLTEKIYPKDFGRIAAQTAKQVIMQKLRDAERDIAYEEFTDKENEILVSVVRRIENNNVFVDIGKGPIEGILMPGDQIRGEKYELNDRIKVYVKKIRTTTKGPQIVVSRASAGLVKRLFENEVPEIEQGVVVIKAIARDAGQRTKMAVWTEERGVDPVGACVGNKGARVNAVVGELGGEKIDIIPWSEDPLEFIARSLSPAKVVMVQANAEEKTARVVVPDDKLSLAIGKDGQNARLAARLTGWKIDVKSQTQAKALEAAEEEYEDSAEDFASDGEADE